MPETRANIAYLTGAVHRRELPVLLVLRYQGGPWYFSHGETVLEDEALVVHIEQVFRKHPELKALSDLADGWAAERLSVNDDWRRYRWAVE